MRIWSRMVSASRNSPVSGSGVLTSRLSRSVCVPSGQVCIRARTSASAVRKSSLLCRRYSLRRARRVRPANRVGHPQDALLGAGRDGGRERVRAGIAGPVAAQQAEVVGARAAPGHLEGVPLHPGARVQRLFVRQRRPRGDQLARLVLHPVQLGALVRRGVPGQHHPADLLVVRAIADHRQAAAPGVGQLGEEVVLLHPLAEPLFVPRHLVQELRVRYHDEPPLLGRDPDRVDVAEPAVVVELGVVVVQDVEVREPLAPRHQPAHRVRDLERFGAAS